MMEHTPGPWEVDGPWQVETDASRLFGEERRTDWRVHGVIGKPGRTIAEVGGWKDRPNAEADARLIAAAPELLEAVNVTLTSWDTTNGVGISDEALSLMEQAIAKATGNDDEVD